MQGSLDHLVVSLAEREVTQVWDKVRRYCGLPWSGGEAETWAFAYYDSIDAAHDDAITSVDVVATASMHPGLSKAELAFFVDRASQLSDWLRAVPVGVPLHQLNDDAVAHIVDLMAFDEINLSLLSKVVHRKRPDAIPLLERHIIDLYRPVTGERAGAKAFPAIVRALRSDLAAGAAGPLAAIAAAIEHQTDRTLSLLRVADIAIWMGGQS